MGRDFTAKVKVGLLPSTPTTTITTTTAAVPVDGSSGFPFFNILSSTLRSNTVFYYLPLFFTMAAWRYWGDQKRMHRHTVQVNWLLKMPGVMNGSAIVLHLSALDLAWLHGTTIP